MQAVSGSHLVLSPLSIEQCCFNRTPDPFNGQTANFVLKPPKVIESRTYVKKANLLLKQHCSITLATAQRGKFDWNADLALSPPLKNGF